MPENISCFVSSLESLGKSSENDYSKVYDKGATSLVSCDCATPSSFKQFYARQSLKYNHERKGPRVSILHANQPSLSRVVAKKEEKFNKEFGTYVIIIQTNNYWSRGASLLWFSMNIYEAKSSYDLY